MAKSVRDLPEDIQALIEVREWEMRTPHAMAVFKKAKVSKLPSIAIAGELAYEAEIPEQDELIKTIRQHYQGG